MMTTRKMVECCCRLDFEAKHRAVAVVCLTKRRKPSCVQESTLPVADRTHLKVKDQWTS